MKFLALAKKEFHRFFHDPRLIVTMLLPGLIIFALYNILGSAINEKEERHYKVYLSGSSEATAYIAAAAEQNGDSVEWLEISDEAAAKKDVEEGNAAAILTFSAEFDHFGEESTVSVLYDAGSDESAAFYSLAAAVLQAYGRPFTFAAQSLTSESEIGTQILGNILPFIVVCFVFSACMSVTLESVAGEKERGTLATILVTSAKRSHIALGEILPLACISMLGAVSSFLGTALSMPKLMGLSLNMLGGYGFLSYFFILLLILSFVPLIVSLIAVVSAFSKSVKEASAYTSVLMILCMMVSLVTAFVPAIGDWVVAIPVLNAVVTIQHLLAGAVPVWQTLVSIGVNAAVTALGVLLMTKMLSSERIMFGK